MLWYLIGACVLLALGALPARLQADLLDADSRYFIICLLGIKNASVQLLKADAYPRKFNLARRLEDQPSARYQSLHIFFLLFLILQNFCIRHLQRNEIFAILKTESAGGASYEF